MSSPPPTHNHRETTEYEAAETSYPAFAVNEEGLVSELKPDDVDDGQPQEPRSVSTLGNFVDMVDIFYGAFLGNGRAVQRIPGPLYSCS